MSDLERANLRETFNSMSDDDFDIFYGTLKENEKKDKKIDQLNNIIDELEKWLDSEIKIKPTLTTYFFQMGNRHIGISEIEMQELARVLDKLKELKENV